MSYVVCFEHEVFAEDLDADGLCGCTLMTSKYPSMRKTQFDHENFERVDA